ncbi:MAG: NAD(+) kinase [Deltaproteobacteria bacterium]|nr:MAG: NAD(+) kinase [Deltaproteobacteria bacterium]
MSESFISTIRVQLNRAGIITNQANPKSLEFAAYLEKWLQGRQISSIRNKVEAGLDIIVTLGGDGTLLKIAEQAARHSIPVVGVNLGSLGFLTELAEAETVPALEQMLAGSITVENRMMLKACMADKNGQRQTQHRYALNEVVINKNTLDKLLNLSAMADGDCITNYRADGLIFSTATGSSAYNLSAGGPLVHPGLYSILVTPICPFMLSSRPILLPGNKIISAGFSSNCADQSAQVIVDGQKAWEISCGQTLLVERAEKPLQLIAASSRNYFQVLRNKLHWGGHEAKAGKTCSQP